MKVTMMQTDIVWANPTANIELNNKRLSEVSPCDVVVFPEMFSTGFVTHPEGVAEKDGQTLNWMIAKAKEHGFAICGSVAVQEGDCFFNRFYFVEPSGKVTSYDKRHLFSFSNEHLTYSPGDKKVVLEYSGVKILLQICYDLRFPETSRNGLSADGNAEYDLALYVASWPSVRSEAWMSLLKARAIENQCYVVGANRTGADPKCDYSGLTTAFDPFGKVIAECKPGIDEFASADVNLSTLASFRKDFPVLSDIIR